MIRDYGNLAAYLAGREAMPFAWGSRANDCISYGAGAIVAQIGIDPLGDLAWNTEAEADALIETLGGLPAALSARLTEVAPALAQRGDIAGVMQGNRLGIMVVEGMTLVGPGPRRAMRRPRKDMVQAWRIA